MTGEDEGSLGSTCTVSGVLEDGRLVIAVRGEEMRSQLYGVEVPVPVPAGYREVITERVPRSRRPLRVRLVPIPPQLPPRAQLHYLAWHDTSGPVWRDLALVLLAEGAARVAPQPFPERDAYLQAETSARLSRTGVWS
ncbi:MAG: nuclease ue [Micromonosporaceae bacterium]